MELTKEKAQKFIEDDFIPNGRVVDINDLRFRKTTEHEVFRCCAQTGSDSQSGPFYCGEIAEWVAIFPAEDPKKIWILALCGKGRHKPSEGSTY